MPGDAHRTHDTDPEVHQNKGWTSQIDPELDPELTEQVGPSPRPILENGAIVDRYVILSHLGSGGMGAVYAAWDQKLARRVALKLLHHDRRRGQDNGWRLQREARALARLDHENVVRVFDVGTWGDAPYITMELIDGPHPRASRGPSPTEWCVASLLKRPHPRASRGPSPTEGALRRS